MIPTPKRVLVIALAAAVNAAGLIDAVVSESWDFVAVFALALLLQLVLLVQLGVGRPAVSVRRDLVAWLVGRASATGESENDLADRCIAAYRAGLVERDDGPVPR